MKAVTLEDNLLKISIEVFKTTVVSSRQDPLALNYLVWLPRDDFVEGYLGKRVTTSPFSSIKF